MKKVLFVAAAIAALFVVNSAIAADMPVKAPVYKAPPRGTLYNWTGFYVGLHAGGAWGKSKATDLDGWNGVGDNYTADTSGFVGGGQLGYNWQIPNTPIVLGVEGDIGYLGFSGSQASALSSDTFVDAKDGWYGTIRGRLGVAPGEGNWLLYVTGGAIFADVRATVQDNSIFPGGGLLPVHPDTGKQTGWIVGGGLEYGFTGAWSGWSVKAEYLHFDLGTKTVTDLQTGGLPIRFDIKNTGNIARLGLNYRF